MTKVKQLMIFLRATFWFIPCIIVTLSILLAMILLEVDAISNYDWSSKWPRLFGAGAEGSRGMLSTIAGSIMTMMGVTFSMTLVTLTLASSQYTSRILRNFIRDRVTQISLGIFAGIFTYCLIVLRAIRGGETVFVPSLSIVTGFGMALLGVGIIVFFIHHVASSIQVSNIIASISQETILAMKNLFPTEFKMNTVEDDFEINCQEWKKIPSSKTGYIQTLDEEGLLNISKKLKRNIKINLATGDFVVSGGTLVLVEGDEDLAEEVALEVEESFSIQRYRTIEQDALFGIRQITDIALKALSPGINDTTTAVICVDYLTSILCYLIQREFPPGVLNGEELSYAIVKRRSFNDFLSEAFSQIRASAGGNRVVLDRIMFSLGTLSDFSPSNDRLSLLSRQADKIIEEASHTLLIPTERADFLEHLIKFKVLKAL